MFFKSATSGDNFWVYYPLTILAVIFGYGIGQVPLVIVEVLQVRNNPDITVKMVEEFEETMDFSLIGLSSNVGLILMITIFIATTLAFMLAIKHLHKLPFKRVITPRSKIDFNKILFGFGLWFVMAFVFEAVLMMIYPDQYYFNFRPWSWVFLLLICLLLLPIQTSLEELVIRGYVMPGISLLTNNKWVPLVISSLLFGAMHASNPEVAKFGFWTMQSYYLLAGLFLGLITILDDSLELALGVHAATNIFGAAFFSFEGSVLQTDSIVKASTINPYMMTLTFGISALIFIAICNKKYKWGGLKNLFAPIGEPAIDESPEFAAE